jgi:hypothetical protein
MPRAVRALALLAVALLLMTPVPPPPPPGPGGPATARLFAEPVALNPDAPGESMLGPLRFLGGWELTSDDRRFGAISALALDGDRLLALSDQGVLFRFAPPPAGEIAILPLSDGPGGADSKVDRDSESMALSGGALWIAYENSNQVWRYDARTLAPAARAAPPGMRRWSANRGAEALARLSGNRFLVIREDVDDQGVSDAMLFFGDPAESGTRAVPLRIDPPEGERITDAASLPDGRLLLLSRRFGLWSGWTGHLLLAELPARSGQLMPVRPVAALESPFTRDNMEAIAITQEEGRTIVWLASDDNLLSLQRTLLLKFEWVG